MDELSRVSMYADSGGPQWLFLIVIGFVALAALVTGYLELKNKFFPEVEEVAEKKDRKSSLKRKAKEYVNRRSDEAVDGMMERREVLSARRRAALPQTSHQLDAEHDALVEGLTDTN